MTEENMVETVVTDRKCEECGGRIVLTYSDFVCEDCGLVLGPRTVAEEKYYEPIKKERKKNGNKN
jgi:predicted RNA-binding Zn-ribbon protein involved in translation (DUF1610 family)